MNTLCKFVITIFWASQFEAVREGYFRAAGDDNGKKDDLWSFRNSSSEGI